MKFTVFRAAGFRVWGGSEGGGYVIIRPGPKQGPNMVVLWGAGVMAGLVLGSRSLGGLLFKLRGWAWRGGLLANLQYLRVNIPWLMMGGAVDSPKLPWDMTEAFLESQWPVT